MRKIILNFVNQIKLKTVKRSSKWLICSTGWLLHKNIGCLRKAYIPDCKVKKVFILTIVTLLFAGISRGYISNWCVIGSGGGLYSTSTAGGFVNVVGIVGQTAVGRSNEIISYSRVYAGYVPGYIKIEDVKIIFEDPSPLSNKWQDSFQINCKITIETYNEINTVKFRITNSGTGDFINDWSTTAIKVDTYDTPKKIRYSISIPTSTSGGKSFAPGDDNYIQWYCRDDGGNEKYSDPFKIKILQPDVKIIQPVDFSSLNPVFEVDFTGPINSDTIKLNIDTIGGEKVLELSGGNNYNNLTGKYRKRWEEGGFITGEKYKLSVEAEDAVGNIYTANSEFIVNEGVIADLIPFPSPFDPLKEGVSIRYVLDEDSIVSILIYDTSGEMVKVLVDEENKLAGLNTQDIWYGKNYADKIIANGIYFCEIVAQNSKSEHRKYIPLAVLGE